MDELGEDVRVLLIDTCAGTAGAGEGAGVALSVGGQVREMEALEARGASAEIVAAVRRMLEGAGWTLAELDRVGVVSGPGSFTGVRAGLAAAKGFVEASSFQDSEKGYAGKKRMRLAAVSRLEVLAEAGGAGADGLAVLDAGRGEFYVRAKSGEVAAREWLCGGEKLRQIAAERRVVVAEERVMERLMGWGFGDIRLKALTVADAVGPVLRCLREGGSDAATVDANYVRGEGDIYRQRMGAEVQARSGAGCSVRRAASEDFAAVLGIERACAEASHWSEAMWREMLEQGRWDAAARVVLVAERAGEVVGFAVAQSAGGSAELESVAVAPRARRRGVGRALCDAAAAWALARDGAAEMHLEVRASNVAALRMYGALGFVERGRRGGYYREPVEDAVAMAREAGSSLRSE